MTESRVRHHFPQEVVSDPTFPAERVEGVFRAAEARMRGLDVVNPRLAVAAVGFAPWDGLWLGVLLTPWCMNLMLLPRDPALWQPLAIGAKRRHTFPAGEYEFVGAHDDALGPYAVCSLISPVLQFADQETAVQVATLARAALLDPANAEVPELPPAAADATATPAAAAGAEAAPGPLAQIQRQLDAPMSKRDLLRGRFRGTDRDDRR